jgi:hypothetical protein
MRLWPDQAEYFMGSSRDLERVHPAYPKCRVPIGVDGWGVFCDMPRPLSCIYRLEARDDGESEGRIEITSLPRQNGFIDLVRQSFVLELAEGAGLQSQRFQFFTQMARQIPMRQVSYPRSSAQLPRVRDAVLEDLARLPVRDGGTE